jgi:hypothetical protein
LFSRPPALPDATVILTAMALGYYSPIFFSLHRLGDPYTAGYWLPRLVLPALLVFFSLGFLMVDTASRRWSPGSAVRRVIPWAFAGYTAVACLLFVGFLW